MESEAENIAWRNFVQADLAHRGHDTEGQGSPITQIVLEYYANHYQAIWHQKNAAMPENEQPSE